MNKGKVIISSVVLIFLLITCNTVNAIVSPTTQFYVNDKAGVLTEETENYIIQTNIDLEQKTGAQIVVVTVPSLEGMDIETYANKLFREWGIGSKEKNNGLLLLCSTGDRLFRVEVGYGLEGVLPDGKTGRMQDEYIIPYLKKDNYNDGIKNGYSAFLQEVANEYGVTISEIQNATIMPRTKKDIIMENSNLMGTIIFFTMAITYISSFICFKNITTKSTIKYMVIQLIQILILWIIIGDIVLPIAILMGVNIFSLIMILAIKYGGRGGSSGGFYGGGFSGRRLFRRRRILRRWRILWWRRKHKRILEEVANTSSFLPYNKKFYKFYSQTRHN